MVGSCVADELMCFSLFRSDNKVCYIVYRYKKNLAKYYILLTKQASSFYVLLFTVVHMRRCRYCCRSNVEGKVVHHTMRI